MKICICLYCSEGRIVASDYEYLLMPLVQWTIFL